MNADELKAAAERWKSENGYTKIADYDAAVKAMQDDAKAMADWAARVLTEPGDGVEAVVHLVNRYAYPDYECEADMKLIAPDIRTAIAGMVARERSEVKRLRAALRIEIDELAKRTDGQTHWSGCESSHPKCAALKRMTAALEGT